MRTEVKEVTTVTSKMEQMIAEDALTQPTTVHVLNEEKPDVLKEKIVPGNVLHIILCVDIFIESPSDPRDVPPSSSPITIVKKNSPTSNILRSSQESPKLRSSSDAVRYGSLEEMYNKPEKAEVTPRKYPNL
jgi:hypothetical protein